MNLLLEIRSRYNKLSETNKRIANMVLNDSNRFLELTAQEIAEITNTSSASVVRFARMFSYPGLSEFKIAIARSTEPTDEENIDLIIGAQDSSEILCNKMEILVRDTFADFFYQIDHAKLKDAIAKLRNANKVHILAMGASSLAGYDLYHKLNRIAIDAVFNFDSHMAIEFSNNYKKGDLVIAISYSGESKEIVIPAKIALEKKADLIMITRNVSTSLSKLSGTLLAVPNNEHVVRAGAIASKFSTMMMIDLLYLGLLQKDFDLFERRLRETSNLTKRLKF